MIAARDAEFLRGGGLEMLALLIVCCLAVGVSAQSDDRSVCNAEFDRCYSSCWNTTRGVIPRWLHVSRPEWTAVERLRSSRRPRHKSRGNSKRIKNARRTRRRTSKPRLQPGRRKGLASTRELQVCNEPRGVARLSGHTPTSQPSR